jgi:hypothetical protein
VRRDARCGRCRYGKNTSDEIGRVRPRCRTSATTPTTVADSWMLPPFAIRTRPPIAVRPATAGGQRPRSRSRQAAPRGCLRRRTTGRPLQGCFVSLSPLWPVGPWLWPLACGLY